MGEVGVREVRLGEALRFVEAVGSAIDVEAAIVHGSVARGVATVRSDVDVIIISEFFRGMKIYDRVGFLLQFKVGRVDPLGYTYDELERMAFSGNPLALGALVEGIFLKASDRVLRLSEEVRRLYVRVGRVWVRKGDV